MRLSALQLLLASVLINVSWAFDGNAQELLHQRVSVSATNQHVEAVIKGLEKSAGVQFLFSREIVQSKRKITYHVQNEELFRVLNAILTPLNLNYEVVGQQIVLKRTIEQTAVPTDKPELTATTEAKDMLVAGIVKDEKGEALPGVNIVLKGTKRGTSTNADGKYSISVPNADAVLIFSAVGTQRQEVVVGNRTEINVTLANDNQTLNEVVVIAYGEQSKKTLSSSVTEIEGDAIGRQTVGTAGDALAALAAGVSVTSEAGGTPGVAPSIVIRGGTSLGTSSDPLYVIDGYPLQDAAQFNLINPQDIETISILKDAASTAIYGSRAANGVVIVTTKRGKAGKTAFTVSAYTGFQRVSKKLDVLDRDEYLTSLRYIARTRVYPAAPALLTPYLEVADPTTLPNTNWQDALYHDAVIRNVQVSASGGTDKARFAISGGYFKQDGVMNGTAYDRYNVRFNMDANLSSKLKVGFSVAPSYGLQKKEPSGGQFNSSVASDNVGTRSVPSPSQNAVVLSPTIPVYLPNGDYGNPYNTGLTATGANAFTGYNPVQTTDLNQNTFASYRIFGNSYLEWTPINGLRLKTSAGATYNVDNQSAYIPGTLASDAATKANLSNPVITNVFARESSKTSLDYLWENTLNYNRQIGDHSFGVLGLFSYQKLSIRSLATQARPGTITTVLLENPLASSDRIGELGYDQNAFISYGGRFTYDFRKKYLLSAAIRTDGSSRFGYNNRYAVFPSVSAGWRVAEEKFWQPVRSTVNEFKLRASIGATGNANIGSFNYLNSVVNRNYSLGAAGSRVFGYAQNGFPNYDLTWEKNIQTDLGLDLGFFNDKFTLTLDYYSRRTTGMLLNQQLPGAVGYATSFRTNIGSLQNRGLELTVGTRGKIGKIQWTVSGNISGNRTKVLDLGGVTAFPPENAFFGWNNIYQVKVGEALGNMNGFQVLGIFKNQSDLDTYAQTGTKADRIGNWIIKDQNGDGKIDESDRVIIGKGVPDFIYGLSTSLQYGNFDLSVLVQGVQGRNIIQGNLRQMWSSSTFNITRELYLNTWDPADPDRETRFPKVGASGYSPSNQLTDRQVYDGSFLRVRNLTIGYTLPRSLLNRIKLQTARLYVTGQNLVTFTKYPGYDPEISIFTNSLITPGIDQGAYPGIRVFTGGFNIGF